ncbi:aspartyl protease family protein [Botrimarina sp.]|uniref:aspartyl protease family protein n=1 Tax=Botrimarina sp. TaxID=2795802 RepID=UPI0032EDE579
MQQLSRTRSTLVAVAIALAVATASRAAAQTPLDGFYPLVGMGITDEFVFDDLLGTFALPETGVGSNAIGPGGTPYYDLALLDTGAALSLVNDRGFDGFGLGRSDVGGGRDGYRGTEVIQLGGATGQLFATINDPFGLYASGLQDRASAGAQLTMNGAVLEGQTNTSTVTLPPESALPNIVGLPFASQYATHIRNDQPQVFQLGGKTIRAPAIDFQPLGSGGGGINRKAPLALNPGSTFLQPPAYFSNILNIVDGIPVHENPTLPTVMQGGLFLNVRAQNNGADLGGTQQFFFDTGASVTVLSQLSALELGFDVLVDEPEFTISIVGSGGLISDVPGFILDEFTVVALGGNVVVQNVPVIVLDVTDPSDPGNIVPGILGTNILSGRNVVIDPKPADGSGGESAGVYISDPVTNQFNWSATTAAAAWGAAPSWDAGATPDLLSVVDARPATASNQTATVSGEQYAWTANVAGGEAGARMRVAIGDTASLTTFSGVSIADGGEIDLTGGVLDAQYVDVRGGRLAGEGQVRVGSGPIEGQVEVVAGAIAPDGAMAIDGRLIIGPGGALEVSLHESQPDLLTVTGSAALEGDLVVTLGYTPIRGWTYNLITAESRGGEFSTVTLPDAYEWDLRYTATGVQLELLAVAGDFNADGRVDAADYSVWRDGLGVDYDQSDYHRWADNYGAAFPQISESVPEPAAAMLVVLALGARGLGRRG